MIKVVIADDSAFLRQVLQEVLEESGKIKVVGLAKNGKEAIQLVKELRQIHLDIYTDEVKRKLLTEIINSAEGIRNAELMLAQAQQEYLAALTAAGICDRCYGKIDDHAISRIKERMQDE